MNLFQHQLPRHRAPARERAAGYRTDDRHNDRYSQSDAHWLHRPKQGTKFMEHSFFFSFPLSQLEITILFYRVYVHVCAECCRVAYSVPDHQRDLHLRRGRLRYMDQGRAAALGNRGQRGQEEGARQRGPSR